MSSVCKVASLHSGSNLSDHVPFKLTLECSGPVVRVPTSSCAFVQCRFGIKHQNITLFIQDQS